MGSEMCIRDSSQVWPMISAGSSNSEIQYARDLRPLFDEDMSAGETPADIHETVAESKTESGADAQADAEEK